ncbi:hypothetical protein CC85DRAFT_269565 [Cutaneotrichosporon oleaginosum]|uniref:Uncharacterized protein n=1 Tax=Cutaneotrichosporon oleaginosum TaxID=879819 RepID=A0A0J0XVX9_9TREE|nr:uncharacterized protein CC85DRAFT_269565 [Cutaneotrichosporon oleaginosum]KLT45193.1 hypothetical protein CC85DRAFT_269565 [Cutaneotrichosporon oleaginosum]TXT14970.1 hypothetical protein COLE_01163 [Cutaneotrichosporon oleaginosum]
MERAREGSKSAVGVGERPTMCRGRSLQRARGHVLPRRAQSPTRLPRESPIDAISRVLADRCCLRSAQWRALRGCRVWAPALAGAVHMTAAAHAPPRSRRCTS